MEIYVKLFFIFIFIFSFLLVLKHDFIRCIDFTNISASEQVMTSQIRSHMEYLRGRWNRETWHRETWQRGTISQGWTSQDLFQCSSRCSLQVYDWFREYYM